MRTKSKTVFKKTPMCELLHDQPAEFFVYLGDYKPRPKARSQDSPEEPDITFVSPSELSMEDYFPVGNWIFVSEASPEQMTDYCFEIADFFKSPAATVDWLAHLAEKAWFDADDFLSMIHRFREATGSFGAL
jgi:hypothetical protein